ncbi:hypothetical protein VTN00DRAFT_3992 [Thermoascus crustaceus]|uniref:uncharacterized protein n=1 Tax=Thermoascus crustaceus TaxID=5088 RepID=UPI003743FA16
MSSLYNGAGKLLQLQDPPERGAKAGTCRPARGSFGVCQALARACGACPVLPALSLSLWPLYSSTRSHAVHHRQPPSTATPRVEATPSSHPRIGAFASCCDGGALQTRRHPFIRREWAIMQPVQLRHVRDAAPGPDGGAAADQDGGGRADGARHRLDIRGRGLSAAAEGEISLRYILSRSPD